MANNSTGKYFVKRNESDSFVDLTQMFQGVAVLSLTGFGDVGESKNIYTAQWIDSQTEDYLVTLQDGQDNDVVVRENVNPQLTVIVSRRYTNTIIDEITVYNALVEYLCKHGAFYIRSSYANIDMRVVCLKGGKPTTAKLNRGSKSYIMATFELHAIEAPQSSTDSNAKLYIGMGSDAIYDMGDIQSLLNVQEYDKPFIQGDYAIVNPQSSWLWICSSVAIQGVTSSGIEVPLADNVVEIENIHCYRSGNCLLSGTINFTLQ